MLQNTEYISVLLIPALKVFVSSCSLLTCIIPCKYCARENPVSQNSLVAVGCFLYLDMLGMWFTLSKHSTLIVDKVKNGDFCGKEHFNPSS